VPSFDLEQQDWLGTVAVAELAGYDLAAARARLPAHLAGDPSDGTLADARVRALVAHSLRRRETQGGDETALFLDQVRGHITLLLDVALLQGKPYQAIQRQAELATFLATAVGEMTAAVAADPEGKDGSARAVRAAFIKAGAALREGGFPPGDPVLGLSLAGGTLMVRRRLLARIALAYYRKGRLEAEAARRHRAFADRELSLLVMGLCALGAADGPLNATRKRVIGRQVSRLELARKEERAARDAVAKPPAPRELAKAAGPKMKEFLLEQLIFSQLADGLASAAAQELVSQYAAAAQIPPERMAALRTEVGAYYSANRDWLDAEWRERPPALGAAQDLADDVSERLQNVVSDNLDALVNMGQQLRDGMNREIRETGELGQLLAKAAAGQGLTAAEKKKVKSQLADLARAVPSLAILAAPGGMLLLPLLAKVLPFKILPSAFEPKPKKEEPEGDGER
jgi:hypothetical protein